jgi:hypothetical protein
MEKNMVTFIINGIGEIIYHPDQLLATWMVLRRYAAPGPVMTKRGKKISSA